MQTLRVIGNVCRQPGHQLSLIISPARFVRRIAHPVVPLRPDPSASSSVARNAAKSARPAVYNFSNHNKQTKLFSALPATVCRHGLAVSSRRPGRRSVRHASPSAAQAQHVTPVRAAVGPDACLCRGGAVHVFELLGSSVPRNLPIETSRPRLTAARQTVLSVHLVHLVELRYVVDCATHGEARLRLAVARQMRRLVQQHVKHVHRHGNVNATGSRGSQAQRRRVGRAATRRAGNVDRGNKNSGPSGRERNGGPRDQSCRLVRDLPSALSPRAHGTERRLCDLEPRARSQPDKVGKLHHRSRHGSGRNDELKRLEFFAGAKNLQAGALGSRDGGGRVADALGDGSGPKLERGSSL